MRCSDVRQCRETLSSGGLPPEGIREVGSHLRTCPACRAVLLADDPLIGVLTAGESPETPAHLALRIQALVRSGRIQEPLPVWDLWGWWRQSPFPAHAAAAATLVLGLAAGFLMGVDSDRGPGPGMVGRPADPLAALALDALADAPAGSLTESYFSLARQTGQGGI